MDINNDFCSNPNILSIFLLFKTFMNIIKIFVPILLIIMSMIELGKVVISSDDGKKSYQKVIKMMIAGALIFLIPTIIEFATTLVDSNKSVLKSNCWLNSNSETIEVLRDMKELADLRKAEEQNKNIPITIDDIKDGISPNTPSLAEQLVDIAIKQKGKKGAEFQKAYGVGTDVPWCNIFIWWVSKEAGVYPAYMSRKDAYTETQLDYFKSGKDANVSWHPRSSNYTPKTGDYIMFNYKSGRRVSHIGIVVSIKDGVVTYVHGNSGSGGSASSKVAISPKKMSESSIVGYGSWY